MQSKDGLKKEVIYVDNGSRDGTTAMIKKKFSIVALIESKENIGFGRANNLGYTKSRGKYILLLNCDAFIGELTLQRVVDYMEKDPECGILGCRLIDKNGQLQPSARKFITPWRLFCLYTDIGRKFPKLSFLKGIDDLTSDHLSIRETDWVNGCFLLVRKRIIEDLGFFLRKDFFMYGEDVDLCLRVKRKSWKVIYYPEDVVHLGGENSRRIAEVTAEGKQIEKYQLESEFIYFRKNYNILYVLEDIFFLLLKDSLHIVNHAIKKNLRVGQTVKHMKLVFKTAINSGFGRKAAY